VLVFGYNKTSPNQRGDLSPSYSARQSLNTVQQEAARTLRLRSSDTVSVRPPANPPPPSHALTRSFSAGCAARSCDLVTCAHDTTTKAPTSGHTHHVFQRERVMRTQVSTTAFCQPHLRTRNSMMIPRSVVPSSCMRGNDTAPLAPSLSPLSLSLSLSLSPLATAPMWIKATARRGSSPGAPRWRPP
jgi:hypothetical protein